MFSTVILTELVGLFIPIIAIISVTAMVCLRLFLNYKKRKDMFALYHQERMAAIDKGIELPPLPQGFFGGNIAPRLSKRSPLLRGLVWFLGGIAMAFALKQTTASDFYAIGLIPAAIGLAYLIYYFVAGRKEMDRNSAPPVIQEQQPK